MNEFIDKISSYNIFNYLLPGIIFVMFSEKFTDYSFIQSDLVTGIFLYYFIGMVISKVGSILVEFPLKKMNILKFAKYSEFITASKKDSNIEILSEQNNVIRTFCSMLIIILILKFYSLIRFHFSIFNTIEIPLLFVLLLVIFLVSYGKQTRYITERIKANQ